MKAVFILGSRNPQGQTARAAEAMLGGVREAGGQAEAVFLPAMTIERCRQCDDDGWGICRTEGRCVIEDDFAPLVEKIIAADAAVFATPVYFSDLSESMRAFLERLTRRSKHEASKATIAGKAAVGICVAGGGGGGAPACAVNLERLLRFCGFEVVDMIPARRQNLAMKLAILEHTGRWLAQGGG
ncbi:MAG: flavodoxin family protein [Bacteroidota bacterium]